MGVLRLCPDAHRPAFRLIHFERAGLADQVAQLAKAISARVKVGGDVREAVPHGAQADPAIFRLLTLLPQRTNP